MKRKPATPSPDSRTLCESIQSIIDSHGRGGLTWAATELGMTPSALQKRLRNPDSAFDAPSLRATLLVVTIKGEQAEHPESPAQVEGNQAQPSEPETPPEYQ